MKRWYFIRHAETDLNKVGIVQGSGVDSSINYFGTEQANAFYDMYNHVPFDRIIVSSLKRTLQTVSPFITNRSIPYIPSSFFNEISWGIHEGQISNPTMIETFQKLISDWEKGNCDSKIENGESANELSSRISKGIQLLTELEGENILICTHGRALRSIISMIKGTEVKDMENYAHANTGLYLVEWQDGIPVFLTENDTSHLLKTIERI